MRLYCSKADRRAVNENPYMTLGCLQYAIAAASLATAPLTQIANSKRRRSISFPSCCICATHRIECCSKQDINTCYVQQIIITMNYVRTTATAKNIKEEKRSRRIIIKNNNNKWKSCDRLQFLISNHTFRSVSLLLLLVIINFFFLTTDFFSTRPVANEALTILHYFLSERTDQMNNICEKEIN